MDITRKEFVVAAGLAGAALSSSVIFADEVAGYDAVVVGGGLAGIVTAISAAEAGAHTLVIEQLGALGGNARYAWGAMNGAGTTIQAEYGIMDSPELEYVDLVGRAGGEENLNPIVARAYAENTGPAVDWLRELGVQFSGPHCGGTDYPPTNVARVYDILGYSVAMVDILIAKLGEYQEQGLVDVLLETHVQDLIVEDGACVGVRLDDGTEYRAPSVVLAAGGYAGSEEMLAKTYTRIKSGALEYSTGEGYRLGLQAGAQMSGMDYNFVYPAYVDRGTFFNNSTVGKRYPAGVIWVDATGKRLIDETSFNGKVRSDAYIKARNNTVFYVFSQDLLCDEHPFIGGDAGNEQFKAWLDEGTIVFAGDTVEELAANAGIDVEGLAATLEYWNGTVCTTWVDPDFGRQGDIQPVTGPLYAVETVGAVTISYGGVVRNDKAQVIGENGEIIPGLYAAGEATSCTDLVGENVIGGAYLTSAVVFGRIAGKEIAAQRG